MLFLVWAEMVLVLVACWYWRKTSLKAERLRAKVTELEAAAGFCACKEVADYFPRAEAAQAKEE